MRSILILTVLLLVNIYAFPQNITGKNFEKPSLHSSAFNNWPSIYKFDISNDGKFVYYTTGDGNYSSEQNLIIKSLTGDWEIKIPDVKAVINFSSDSKKLICLTKADSLCIVTLGNSQFRYVINVQSFKIVQFKASEYLVYQMSSPGKDLVIQDLKNSKDVVVKHVLDYKIASDENAILVKIDSVLNGENKQFLFFDKLDKNGSRIFVHGGENLTNLALNKKGNGVAFINDDNGFASIWFYSLENHSLQQLYSANQMISKGLEVDRISGFSEDGLKLFIYVKEKPVPIPRSDSVKVNVWSFKDAVVQSAQFNNLMSKSYLAVINLKDQKLVRLQYKNERDVPSFDKNDKFIYLIKNEGDYREGYWNNAAVNKAFVVSNDDGSRKQLDDHFNNPQFSPDGKYFISYDNDLRHIYSYEFSTGNTLNLTEKLPVLFPANNILRDILDVPAYKYASGLGFAAWKEGDKILISDEFDIWEIDLKGRNPPINITNGFGRENKIVFRLTSLDANKMVSKSKRLIVSAFNKANKNSGFYEITNRKNSDPQKLSMDGYWFSSNFFGGRSLIKAKAENIYLVVRESAKESPNLYWTGDFKTFNPISSIFPEKDYNWLTSELRSFTTLDGRIEQGVLYKPEDFDGHKKYPVIIYYYERMSNELNKYHNPGKDPGALDISWLVSHGYIVFTPDIHYKISEIGQSTYNVVVAAAKYLKTLSFIDGKKIGLHGHSFGGYETNYLVANSKIFAAAISSSGASNFITAALSDNIHEQFHLQQRQYRLDKLLWEDIPMYIKNSPVFKAYKVSTPLMLIHNRVDNNVPFIQGLEWFMALRRLGKRAWMLQYDDGGHGLFKIEDYVDYVIRSTQFFDHYLKDSAAPRWMLHGIAAKDKGVIDGLDLIKEKDPKTGKWLTPKEGGLLTEEQKKKVEALKRRKPITLKLE